MLCNDALQRRIATGVTIQKLVDLQHGTAKKKKNNHRHMERSARMMPRGLVPPRTRYSDVVPHRSSILQLLSGVASEYNKPIRSYHVSPSAPRVDERAVVEAGPAAVNDTVRRGTLRHTVRCETSRSSNRLSMSPLQLPPAYVRTVNCDRSELPTLFV